MLSGLQQICKEPILASYPIPLGCVKLKTAVNRKEGLLNRIHISIAVKNIRNRNHTRSIIKMLLILSNM